MHLAGHPRAILEGVTVVEIADYVYVPAAATVLADWGAQVIKIEHHERGDAMRGLKTAHAASGRTAAVSPVMSAANRGKQSIGINLGTDRGTSVLHRLVAAADVVLTSKLESVRCRLRIDSASLRAINPQLIYATGSAHGAHGPDADRGGFDQLDFWWRSGMAAAAQPFGADYMPLMPAPGFGDFTSGMYLAGGVVAALFHRERTNEAIDVDSSLLASGMWTLGAAIALDSFFGIPSRQVDPRQCPPNPMVATYATSDGGWIALCTLAAFQHWPTLCDALHHPQWKHDVRWSTPELFAAARAEIRALIRTTLLTDTLANWRKRLEAFTGQWSVVQRSTDLANDPQVVSNHYLSECSDGLESFDVARSPIKFGGRETHHPRAPEFNTDLYDVLQAAGYDAAEIVELQMSSAVA